MPRPWKDQGEHTAGIRAAAQVLVDLLTATYPAAATQEATTMLKNEPVIWHSAIAAVIGIASLWVPGIEEIVSVLLTGVLAALARGRVSPTS